MAKDSDMPLTVLVMIATALVLSAPVLGRIGFSFAADVVVSVAAVSGVGAFLLAAAHSLVRLQRAPVPRKSDDAKKSPC